MKRHALAFLLHPYKNVLVSRERLKESADRFAEILLALAAEYENIRWNVAMPGYILESIDGILLSKLREVQKRECLEWLCCGYTEPFLSFSPAALTRENIRTGQELLTEMTGAHPSGFIPPFSNWEPSHISSLKELGFNYAAVSNGLFPQEFRSQCNYWATEHQGSSLLLFPLNILHRFSAPWDISGWLDQRCSDTTSRSGTTKLICISYLLPLVTNDRSDSFDWVRRIAETLEKNILQYQSVRFEELLAMNPATGLQHLPPSLMLNRQGESALTDFQNYLHTFDQVGLLQRRVMEVSENLAGRGSSKHLIPLRKELFYAQDINHYLPSSSGGFLSSLDRQWSYAKIIKVESHLHETDKIDGGQIRIADILKNGSKSVIMSNKSFKAYLDHRNGGHLFELDYRPRAVNLCAGCSTKQHKIPRLLVPGKSKTAFVDHVVPHDADYQSFMAGNCEELGDFFDGAFEYTIKKTPSTLKCALIRNGSISGEKTSPLTIEKVFGLEGDHPRLTFVYHLSNHSLIPLTFRFATEITIHLPGACEDEAYFSGGKVSESNLSQAHFSVDALTSWNFTDKMTGMQVAFTTQKPVTLWCFPANDISKPYQGTTMVITTLVDLQENEPWKLMGKVECKKIRRKAKELDAC